MRIGLIIVAILSTFMLMAQPKVASGALVEISDFASKYVSPRNVYVWLPEGYVKEKSYPVLYMHDGQMLFDSTVTWNKQEWGVDEVVQQLIDAGEIRQCIVVGVSNVSSERHSDYFPEKPFMSLSKEVRDSLMQLKRGQSPLFGKPVNSDNYLKFLVYELKPYVDKNFSTSSARENTFIAGSSMGGLISMYAFFEYPDIFGGAACLSTHWIGGFAANEQIPQAFQNYMSFRKELLNGRKLYFDYGTETLDQFYPSYQKKVDQVFQGRKSGNNNYMSREFPGAAHTERDWNARLPVPVKFLLSVE